MVNAVVADLVRAGRLLRSEVEQRLGSAAMLERQLATWSELGLPIELDRQHLHWRPDATPLSEAVITAALAQAGWPIPAQVHVLIESSSDFLLAAAAAGEPAPQLCFAECQSAGRGRRQRRWRSRYGDALLWSILLDPGRPLAQLPGLAIVAGVALVDALHAKGWCEVGLKWPNDLVTAAGKLGGILVEVAPGLAGAGAAAVVGVGLNLRSPPSDVAAAPLDQMPTALFELAAASDRMMTDRSVLAAELAIALLAAAERFRHEGLAPFLLRFADHDVLAGRELEFEQNGVRCHGQALGLAADGALRVATSAGELRLYSADTSVRPV